MSLVDLRDRRFFQILASFIKPSSVDRDRARREFILHVLTLGSFLLSLIATITSIIKSIGENNLFRTELVQNLLIPFIFLSIYYLSRSGKSKLAAQIFITFYLSTTLYASLIWGASLPQGLLTYSLLVVMSGILISSFFSFFVTAIISTALISLTYFQSYNPPPRASVWTSDVSIMDGIVFSITLFLIALVSWLFNRESEQALKRARASELELKRQRDTLAEKVEEKTKELRIEQSKKIAQLYQFAEFGKLASGIMHDLSNSVQLISANLKQIERKNGFQDMHEVIGRANIGVDRLQGFIGAMRKQVNNQDYLDDFSINEEIRQVMQILSYKAKIARVTFDFHADREIRTFGNPIKFHQMLSNLLSNAIDAYDQSRKKKREVLIRVSIESGKIRIQVADSGKGIAPKDLPHIFEPFFTTKGFKKGTGIGLSITHDIVVKEFRGKISVQSKRGMGCIFTVVFPQQKANSLL